MQCALCQLPKELQNSHIIPEFLYTSLYDEKHRYNVLTALPEETNRIEQKGARERLLCADCEGLLSRYERYGSQILQGGAKEIHARRDGNVIHLTGMDYKSFKLFLLSILWRADASKLPMFNPVSLGPHSEQIRSMLLNGDPGQPQQYPCILFGLTMQPGETPALMIPPESLRIAGYRAYRFVLPGILAVFFVASLPAASPYLSSALQGDGSICVQVRSVMELQTLHMFMARFDKLGRRPRLEA